MHRALLIATSLLLLSSCGADKEYDPCFDLSCTCENAPDCPNGYICFDQTCHPNTERPSGARCEQNEDCIDGSICQNTISICVSRCSYPESSNSCGSGFLCHSSNECLPHHSLRLDDSCFHDQLCPVEATCVGGSAFLCKVTCSAGYDTTQCPEGRYCAINSSQPTCNLPVPVCTPGQSGQCPMPKECIDLGGGVAQCLRPCTYSVDAGGTFNDDCAAQIGYHPASCAPLGPSDEAICIEATNTGGQAGASCNRGTLRCSDGHVCHSGRCRALCSGTCAAGTCTAIGGIFSACLP